jgi:putative cell wall-binding protein
MHSMPPRLRLAAVAAALAATLSALLVPTAASAAPMVQADSYSLGAAEPFTPAAGAGILANDAEVDIPGRFISISTRPMHGKLTLPDNSGAFTYTPDLGFVGADRFVYCVSLGAACVTNEATVTLDVVAHVVRIEAADRFAESAAISASRFAAGVAVAYVASGQVFPDALSAGPAAGAIGSPVLLVTKDAIPDSIQQELARLAPKKIIVLGGVNTISVSVQNELRALTGAVTRYDGADRYEVSAKISANTFRPGLPAVYIASGEVFPDALSASAAAGLNRGPVLLVSKDAVPQVIADEVGRLKPGRIVVLGGVNTVSDAVVARLDVIAPATRTTGADRYEVSANTAAGAFIVPKGVVFIASGEVFPDALSGSPAAITRAAPVLLVSKNSIPASVEAQLARLTPSRIVVLGGPNSISTQVEAQLATYLAK